MEAQQRDKQNGSNPIQEHSHWFGTLQWQTMLFPFHSYGFLVDFPCGRSPNCSCTFHTMSNGFHSILTKTSLVGLAMAIGHFKKWWITIRMKKKMKKKKISFI